MCVTQLVDSKNRVQRLLSLTHFEINGRKPVLVSHSAEIKPLEHSYQCFYKCLYLGHILVGWWVENRRFFVT